MDVETVTSIIQNATGPIAWSQHGFTRIGVKSGAVYKKVWRNGDIVIKTVNDRWDSIQFEYNTAMRRLERVPAEYLEHFEIPTLVGEYMIQHYIEPVNKSYFHAPDGNNHGPADFKALRQQLKSWCNELDVHPWNYGRDEDDNIVFFDW